MAFFLGRFGRRLNVDAMRVLSCHIDLLAYESAFSNWTEDWTYHVFD